MRLAALKSHDDEPILEVKDLRTYFRTESGDAKAVDGVDFSLTRGKILGIVGESGSGKSVTGFSIMNLIDKPGYIAGGSIRFKGRNLRTLSENEMRQLRGNRIAMIFQDPMMTLNPVLRIETQMIDAIQAHANVPRRVAWERSRDALGLVGIPSPAERMSAYPHQFSGGMRQRVAIAISLLNNPDLVIADEPTTALDVTIQSQILAEVQHLVRNTTTSVIWITHDLSIVARLADEVAVMYAGKFVEIGAVDKVMGEPRHPYTQGLLDSVPSRNRRGQRLRQISGMTPSLLDLPSGCAFRPRCGRANEECLVLPELRGLSDQRFRCFHPVGRGISGNGIARC